MQGINYHDVAQRRRANYEYLRQQLGGVVLQDDEVPMIFPYEAKDGRELRNHLIKNKIFVAKYWPNVEEWVGNDSNEVWMANNVLPLPIDQRYTKEEMNHMLNVVNL